MVKKLRIRFVVVTMIIVLAILSALIGVINGINYKRTTDNADDILQILSYNDGIFAPDFKPVPEKPPKPSSESSSEELTDETDSSTDENESSTDNESSESEAEEESEELTPTPDHITIEPPFETRYFSVKFSETDAVADTSHISTFSEQEAIEIAKIIYARHETEGYFETYRFMIDREKSLVIFIDWTRQLQTVESFTTVSVLCALCVAVIVFFLAVFLSAGVVRPIGESYDRQKRFISDASHELKTPLTIISANNELMELTQGENEYTASISKQVAKMTNMIKNLSSLVTIDEFVEIAKQSAFSFSSICDEICDHFNPVLTKENRKFIRNIEQGVEFYGDEALIRQLISSLLENASKYALSFTKISLSLVGRKIHLLVENDASVVEQGNLNRCFERFYRSDEARASGIDGSGIGLCVCEEIVTIHGGQISAKGEGNVFSVEAIL